MTEAHRRHVSKHRCVACHRGRLLYEAITVSQAAHVKFIAPGRGKGYRKGKDAFCVPLCPTHHALQHAFGDEEKWWQAQGIDPAPIAEQLVATSPCKKTREPVATATS